MFTLHVPRKTYKDFDRIQSKDLEKIDRAIELLRGNPLPVGAKKLAGQDFFRIRQGDYRIIYHVDWVLKIVTIARVGHRKDVYRLF